MANIKSYTVRGLPQTRYSVVKGLVQITHDRTNALNTVYNCPYLMDGGLIYQRGDGIYHLFPDAVGLVDRREEIRQVALGLGNELLDRIFRDPNFTPLALKFIDMLHDFTGDRVVTGFNILDYPLIKKIVDTNAELGSEFFTHIRDEFYNPMIFGQGRRIATYTHNLEEACALVLVNLPGGKVGPPTVSALNAHIKSHEHLKNCAFAVDVINVETNSVKNREEVNAVMTNTSLAKLADQGRIAVFLYSEYVV
jgi:hypothetical protein